jgi:ubiquinone/menaquinone biosynthesis C-methylase UbiE
MSHHVSRLAEMPVRTLGTDRACPACRVSGHRPFGTKGGHALLHCSACGTIYSGTKPCGQALDEIYDHYYDQASFELHPVTGAALDRLARSFSPFRSTNRWLDVGYGAGGLLTVAESHGWSCHGVEISPSTLRYGADRGWQVAESMEAACFRSARFDVVTMIELIEHVTAPDELLDRAARLLRPGGLLYVTTPNSRSLNRRILGLDWSVIAPPEHLTIWSPQGLCQALVRAGFVPTRVRAEGLNPSELSARLRPARPECPPLNRNEAARALNEIFSRSPLRRNVKAAINGGLSLLRAGDRLKVWAIRGPGLCEP